VKINPENAQCVGDSDTLSRGREVGGRWVALPDQERAARLRRARELAGFDTAADAARQFNWAYSTYGGHENGSRGIPSKKILTYATSFNVSAQWLLSGLGEARGQSRRVRVEGTLGMDGIVQDAGQKQQQEIVEEVEYPPGATGEYIAFKVEGNTNFPAFFGGDVIYASLPADPEQSIGRQCIATLRGGERRVCILARGAATGLFMLMSFNAAPLPDVEVIAAAPIVWIKRG